MSWIIIIVCVLIENLCAPSKTTIKDVGPFGNNGNVTITWKSLSSTFRILYYIVSTSDNRYIKVNGTKTCVEMKFNVSTQKQYVTVTGVDYAENVGEESDRYYFILDSELMHGRYLLYCTITHEQ